MNKAAPIENKMILVVFDNHQFSESLIDLKELKGVNSIVNKSPRALHIFNPIILFILITFNILG